MSLDACLPAELRGPSTTITRIAAGLSGAGVYRVEASGQVFVLKISADSDPIADWRRKLHIQQLAASAGLAPRVVHADEAHRAVVSGFVVDRSFPAFYGDPRTHAAALAQLARTLRRVHDLPLPPDPDARDPRDFLTALWSGLASFPLPAFVGDAVQRVLTAPPPARDRAPVLSHNDVNPTNLVHDGEHLLLLDWDTAGPNDPFYDLAAIAVFLRMDDETCRTLLATYDDAPVSELPAGFTYHRRLVAVLCGTIFLHMARHGEHTGATGGETLDTTTSLGELYQQMRSGALNVATAEGKWRLGLALVQASAAL